jgi:hypothetical protein
VAVEVINEVIIAWLVIKEVVTDAQKVLHLSKPSEAGATFVVVVIVGVEDVGVGACLGRCQDVGDGAHELLGQILRYLSCLYIEMIDVF